MVQWVTGRLWKTEFSPGMMDILSHPTLRPGGCQNLAFGIVIATKGGEKTA